MAIANPASEWTSDRGERKDHGVFYTPRSVADFMATWAIRGGEDRVLEPAAGGGVFLRAAADRLRELGSPTGAGRVVAVEVADVAAAALRALEPEAQVRSGSFLDLSPSELPAQTVILGNPPYVRHHRLDDDVRAKALDRAAQAGVELSGLSSLWAHMLVHACAFLDPAVGRLALVLPVELLTSDYAGAVRSFLLGRFPSVRVVSFREPIFPDAQVDAVLLLASMDGAAGLTIERIATAADLAAESPSQSTEVDVDRWHLGLDAGSRAAYRALAQSSAWTALGSVAKVGIGVVTGANRFFIVDEARRQELGLPDEFVRPILERPRHIHGLAAEPAAAKVLLAIPRATPRHDLPPGLLAYIEAGEAAAFDQRFKCAARDPWYSLRLPESGPLLLLPYMSHGQPRLIVNSDRLLASNLIHGVEPAEGTDGEALAIAALGSASAFSAEVEGRTYGGGVFKLEPSEAKRLLVPVLGAAAARRLKKEWATVDRLVREGQLEAARDVVDDLLRFRNADVGAAIAWFRDRRAALSAPARRRAFVAAAPGVDRSVPG